MGTLRVGEVEQVGRGLSTERQGGAKGDDIAIGHFRHFGSPVLFELQADERICLCVAEPDRHADDRGEGPQLEYGRAGG